MIHTRLYWNWKILKLEKNAYNYKWNYNHTNLKASVTNAIKPKTVITNYFLKVTNYKSWIKLQLIQLWNKLNLTKNTRQTFNKVLLGWQIKTKQGSEGRIFFAGKCPEIYQKVSIFPKMDVFSTKSIHFFTGLMLDEDPL